MATFSKLSNQVKIGAPISALIVLLFILRRIKKKNRRSGGSLGRKNIVVDKQFLMKVLKLLKMSFFQNGIPGYFIVFNILLVLRTILSIQISTVKGKIVKGIISSNQRTFLKEMGNLALYAIPGAFTNSALDYYQKLISLNIRKGLVQKFNKKFMNGKMFYQISHVDNRTDNPDQILTEDINILAEKIFEVYADFSKPLLDIFLFSRKLAQVVTWRGPVYMISWYLFTGWIQQQIIPSFGRLIAQGLHLEGLFRSGHQRILQHSEEIAFLRGGKFEKKNMKVKFQNLLSLYHKENNLRFYMGIFESILIKYGAYNLGFSILALPVFGPGKKEYLLRVANDPSKIIKDYEQNSSLLVNLAKSIGRIVVSFKKIQNLAGITFRVYGLMEVMDDMRYNGRYQRNIVDNKELIYDPSIKANSLQKGQILKVADQMKFQEVPVFTPSGEKLITELSFRIKKGMNTVIIGPNGSGKTALLRVMAGLWPFFQGQIFKVQSTDVFYLPQTAYMPKGKLRDLLTYPSVESNLDLKKKDFELKNMLEMVQLDYLVKREGFDAEKEWYEILSGGEKQRISIIRMLYHNPKFAILDEATSEISVDIENEIYNMAKKRGITLITVVTQKKSFFSYHDYVLRLAGDGEWVFEEINHDD